MARDYALFICADSTKCTGCKACEIACFKAHNVESNSVGQTVGTVSVPVTPKLYVTVGEEASMPIQCKHCENAPCKIVCSKNALSRDEDGVVSVDEEKCVGCKDCLLACPFGAVTLLPYFRDGKQVISPESGNGKLCASKCDLCFLSPEGPACVNVCPNGALRIADVNAELDRKNIASAEAQGIMNREGRSL